MWQRKIENGDRTNENGSFHFVDRWEEKAARLEDIASDRIGYPHESLYVHIQTRMKTYEKIST